MIQFLLGVWFGYLAGNPAVRAAIVSAAKAAYEKARGKSA